MELKNTRLKVGVFSEENIKLFGNYKQHKVQGGSARRNAYQ